MSLSSDIAHGYQPLAASGDGSRPSLTPLRINKRITAKPTTFVPHRLPPCPSGPEDNATSSSIVPLTARLALKTTYNLRVPSWMTERPESFIQKQATLSSLELAERGKQVLKHAEVLRSQTGRIKLRVGCVVDGQTCGIDIMQEAFVEGIRQVSLAPITLKCFDTHGKFFR